MLDLHGSLLVVNPFDSGPFDRFQSSGDGQDIYQVISEDVSGRRADHGRLPRLVGGVHRCYARAAAALANSRPNLLHNLP
jgi:hypothetical protein